MAVSRGSDVTSATAVSGAVGLGATSGWALASVVLVAAFGVAAVAVGVSDAGADEVPSVDVMVPVSHHQGQEVGPADRPQDVQPDQASQQTHEHAEPSPAGGPAPDQDTSSRSRTFEAPYVGADASAKVTMEEDDEEFRVEHDVVVGTPIGPITATGVTVAVGCDSWLLGENLCSSNGDDSSE